MESVKKGKNFKADIKLAERLKDYVNEYEKNYVSKLGLGKNKETIRSLRDLPYMAKFIDDVLTRRTMKPDIALLKYFQYEIKNKENKKNDGKKRVEKQNYTRR